MRSLPVVILPFLVACPLYASDLEVAVVPRVSVGGVSGIGMTTDAFRRQVDAISDTTGTSAMSDYQVNVGVNAEAPLIIDVGWSDKPIHIICGPAFVASWNRNDLSIGSGDLTVDGTETVTAMGGKGHLGIGIRCTDRLHLEALPYLGVAAVRRRLDLMTVDRSMGTHVGTATDARGHMTLYGFTTGLYFTPPAPARSQVGIRVGLVGAKGSVDGTEFRQQGGLIAIECGCRI